jgi:PAS domain S-box-containing protein
LQIFGIPASFVATHALAYPSFAEQRLIWLHAVSGTLIALACFSIPATLLLFLRKRKDLRHGWVFDLFAIFLVFCGLSQAVGVWNLWHSDYWVGAFIRLIAAAISVPAAILVIRQVPWALELPSNRDWIKANADLQSEIQSRRDLEMDLRVRESAYREQAELLDLIHDAVFVRSFDGRILYWNKGAEQLYGWTSDEVKGRISHQLLHTAFPVHPDQVIEEVIRKRRWEGELVHTRRDGSKCVVSSRWVLRDGPAENFGSVLETNRDITLRKQEEQRFQSLLESAPDAIVITNQHGIIQLVNAQAENLFGYPRKEMMGQPIEVLIPARFRNDHVSHRSSFSESPRPRAMGAGLDLHGLRKDGSEFPVEVSLSPLETAEGILISSAIRDVTERRRIQEQLARAKDNLEMRVIERTRELEAANEDILHSHERLELAQKVALIGVFDYNLDAECATWSEGMFEIYGVSDTGQTITREFWQSLMLPESMAIANRKFDEQIETTGIIDIEFQIRRPDGAIRWIASRGKLFPDRTGKKVRLVGVNADVTDTKLREEEARSLNVLLERRVEERTAELRLANKELESFSYSVSHDLRAPLRHMDGFARILKEEFSPNLPPDGVRYLDRIVHAANQMGHLVDDLLALSRINRKEFLRRRVALRDLVEEVRKDMAADLEGRSVEWGIETLPEADCDPGLVKIVFTNLISNALKFTRPRPVSKIEIGVCSDSEQPEVFIRDNGVGFDSKYADKLFGVFQRLHRDEEFEGTGVGLATVQRIIHRHGGEIRAESRPGEGAAFYFTLGRNSIVRPSEPSSEVQVGRI